MLCSQCKNQGRLCVNCFEQEHFAQMELSPERVAELEKAAKELLDFFEQERKEKEKKNEENS